MAKWNLNTDHSTAAFSIRHLEIINIRGIGYKLIIDT